MNAAAPERAPGGARRIAAIAVASVASLGGAIAATLFGGGVVHRIADRDWAGAAIVGAGLYISLLLLAVGVGTLRRSGRARPSTQPAPFRSQPSRTHVVDRMCAECTEVRPHVRVKVVAAGRTSERELMRADGAQCHHCGTVAVLRDVDAEVLWNLAGYYRTDLRVVV